MFPIDKKHESARKAVKASVGAAREILKKLNTLHFEIPEDHNLEHGLKSLQTGIGLHIGEVFFGNMGAPGRLDFTVIGKAVNEVSRVEALCKELERALLITEPVAQFLDCDLENVGTHQLRGIKSKMTLYSIM